MGVNMPARSVIFTAIHKHDGQRKRPLLPGAFAAFDQHNGRAERVLRRTMMTMFIGCPVVSLQASTPRWRGGLGAVASTPQGR